MGDRGYAKYIECCCTALTRPQPNLEHPRGMQSSWGGVAQQVDSPHDADSGKPDPTDSKAIRNLPIRRPLFWVA